MAPKHPPELSRYFDHAIDKIGQHASYSQNLARAVEAGQTLILNYHTHGPGQGYCASICVSEGEVALLGLRGELRELAHLRGIGQREDECEPLMAVFAARLAERFELAQLPETWLDGKPLAQP